MTHELSRRGLLAVLGATVGTAVVGRTPARAAAAQLWPDVAASALTACRIEGSDATALLLPGDVAVVLTHVARRFSYEVTPLSAGDAAGSATGTGITLLPRLLPYGADGLFPLQVMVVRDILGECQGVVRWGGDDELPCQGAFRIDVPPGDDRLRLLATALPSPGGPVDLLDPARRGAALALARRQAR